MNSKRGLLTRTFVMIVLFCLSFSFVSAIGISPAKATINYEGPFSTNISYNIRSNNNFPIVAGVELGGSMLEYVTVYNDEIPLAPGASGSFKLNLDIPQDHDYAGKQIVWVKAYEKEVDRGTESTIMVTTSASAAIVVYFPYPGKYIDIKTLKVENVKEGEDSNLEWELISRGEQDVTYGVEIEIFDSDDTVVITKEYARTNLKAGDTYGKKEVLSTKNLKPGRYNAILTLDYNGKSKSKEASFNIGEEDVELVDYTPKNLTFGEINKMKLSVKSLWNDDFDNVYATIKIDSAEASTPTATVTPFKTIKLEQFIDISGLNESEYDGMVTIFFADTSKEYPITVNIVKPIVIVPEEPRKGISMLSITFILLALILIALVIVVLRQKKKSYP